MTIAVTWRGDTWGGTAWAGKVWAKRTFIDSATSALLARMTSPSAENTAAINACIVALKAGGVWDKLDVLQVYACNAEANALLNWKGTSYSATNNGATFTADRGVAGNAASTWLDTGFNPTGSGRVYATNSAHVSVWIETDGADSDGHGAATTAYVRHAASNITGRINDATTSTFGATSPATGLMSLIRRGASDKRAFHNGAQIGSTLTTASTAIPNATMGIGRWNTNATYTDDRIALFCAGEQLSDAEEVAKYNAFRAYMTAVGVA